MSRIAKIIRQMQVQPNDVRFDDAVKVCEEFFGPPRKSGGSHVVFKTPWQSDPRINLQSKNGHAKAYQVRQILLALEKLGVL